MTAAAISQFCLWLLTEAEREEMSVMLMSELAPLDPGDDAESNDSSVGSGSYGIGNSNVKGDVAVEVLKYLEGTSKTLDCCNDSKAEEAHPSISHHLTPSKCSSAMVVTSLPSRGTF